MKIILASASPRRQALLRQIGMDFEVMVSDVDENTDERAPEALVKGLALAKAESVSGRAPSDAVIIGADTIVYLDGIIMGKPSDNAEAFCMLKKLSGRAHEVYTGLAVLRGRESCVTVDRTLVYMRELSDAEINAYVASGGSDGKAGAYGIQDRAALFVNRIEGDFFTVVGLPLYRLASLLDTARSSAHAGLKTQEMRSRNE